MNKLKYKFGFSIRGFLSFILAMIPNIIWMIIPPANDILAQNSASQPVFDIILNISQWVMIAALIILINKTTKDNKRGRLFVGLAVLCLMIYYISWILYYTGIVNPWMLVAMAIFPTLYFIFVEFWIKNYIALMPSIIFGIIHTVITYSNYLR